MSLIGPFIVTIDGSPFSRGSKAFCAHAAKGASSAGIGYDLFKDAKLTLTSLLENLGGLQCVVTDEAPVPADARAKISWLNWQQAGYNVPAHYLAMPAESPFLPFLATRTRNCRHCFLPATARQSPPSGGHFQESPCAASPSPFPRSLP